MFSKNDDPNSRALIAVLFFVMFFYLFRMNEIHRSAYNEEGMFAKILATSLTKPNFIFMARIDGQEIFQPPRHPALMYEMINGVGAVPRALQIFGDDPAFNDRVVRMIFSLFTLVPFIFVIFLHCRTSPLSVNFLLILGLVAISPIIVKNSMMAQLDGSIGVVLSSVVVIAFQLRRNLNNMLWLGFVFTASMLFGFGRNEWIIIFFLALILSSLMFLKKRNNEDFVVFLMLLGGGLFGSWLSWFYDSDNFMDGFIWMAEVVQRKSVFNEGGFQQLALKLKSSFWELNLPLALCFLTALNRRNWWGQSFEKLFLQLLAYGLFFSALLSLWNMFDTRYYMPSIAVLFGCFLMQFESLNKLKFLTSFLVLLLFLNAGLFISGWVQFQSRSLVRGDDPNCVYYVETALVWDHPNFSFIGNMLEESVAITEIINIPKKKQ